MAYVAYPLFIVALTYCALVLLWLVPQIVGFDLASLSLAPMPGRFIRTIDWTGESWDCMGAIAFLGLYDAVFAILSWATFEFVVTE